MGKLKKGRRNARVNPLRSSKPEAKQEAKDEATRTSKVVPLMEKLRSTVPNDKAMGLSAITLLTEDPRLRRLFLKEKLIANVMEYCLNDLNDELVVEAYGLLRNLGIEEGYEVLKHYWRSNIWTSIELALTKIETSFKYLSEKPGKEDKVKLALLYDFTDNVLSLITTLASGSDDLFDSVFAKIDGVLKLVVDLLAWNTPVLRVSPKLFTSLLDFLFEFSSESADFIAKLAASPFDLDQLAKSPVVASNRVAKVLFEGIRLHLLDASGQAAGECPAILANIFSAITSINLDELKAQFIVDNAKQPIQKEDDKPKDIDQQITGDSPEKIQAKQDLQAIESAVDITTVIWELVATSEPPAVSDELLSIVFSTVFPALVQLTKLDQDSHGLLAISEKLLVAFNNLAWLFLSTPSIPVQWFDASLTLWDIASHLALKDNLEIQKNSLSVLWAITKAIGPEARNRVNPEWIVLLVNRCTELLSRADDALAVEFILAAVGFLGSVAPIVQHTPTTKLISDFLLKSAVHFSLTPSASTAEIPVECVNLIFDIFGDLYDYDEEIFVRGNYIEALTQLEPQIKALYKQLDRKKNPDLKLRAEESWSNLGRFISYKQSERS